MRRPRWWFLLALVVTLAAFAAGCGGDDEEGDGEAGGADTAAATDTEAAEPVECSATIGIMGPFTGDVAAIGQEQLNWAKFAVEHFNEENGTDFTLFEGDDPARSRPGLDASPRSSSRTSDIVAVVGPAGSQEVEAVGEIFGRRRALPSCLASATATALTERSTTRLLPRRAHRRRPGADGRART